MTELRQRMIRDMELRGLSPHTKRSYLGAVRGLAKFYHRAPDTLSREEVQDYLLHLEQDRKMAWNSSRVAVTGLRFFYGVTTQNSDMLLAIPARKRHRRLPVVLSREEVMRIINGVSNPKHRLMLMTAYSGGLRVSEVVRLKLTDFDFSRMTIRVELGKCNKDRYTLLSRRLAGELEEYVKHHRTLFWLFPSNKAGAHISVVAAQKVYAHARAKAQVSQGSGIHTLRHCFATHLLEDGVDIYTIQKLMGHRQISTTAVYLHLTAQGFYRVESPMDKC
ncbi:MAG TPA: site-specific integrase [Deltaproteobacteria bacterium]|nr:site-specific integrase [Deltaproteobacteria bacterium]